MVVQITRPAFRFIRIRSQDRPETRSGPTDISKVWGGPGTCSGKPCMVIFLLSSDITKNIRDIQLGFQGVCIASQFLLEAPNDARFGDGGMGIRVIVT